MIQTEFDAWNNRAPCEAPGHPSLPAERIPMQPQERHSTLSTGAAKSHNFCDDVQPPILLCYTQWPARFGWSEGELAQIATNGFSAKAYAGICDALVKSGYRSSTLLDWIRKTEDQRAEPLQVVLRHDVDRFPSTCLALARIEAEAGLKASYYFRVPYTSSPAVIREVARLGHEIGFHYESLDKGRGDPARAIQSFAADLKTLREHADIATVVMHGNPLSPWNNRDLWEHTELAQHGLVGEGYLSIDFSQLWYFSDTGRSWSEGGPNLKDHLPQGQHEAPGKPLTSSTRSLVDAIQSKSTNLYILTHPERWPSTPLAWGRSWAFDFLANSLKRALRVVRGQGSKRSSTRKLSANSLHTTEGQS